MSKITNLIGTTWRLGGENLELIAEGYGIYNIVSSGSFYYLYQFWNVQSDTILAGYYGLGDSYDVQEGAVTIHCTELVSAEVSDATVSNVYQPIVYDAGSYYEFTITGGTDISNLLFIDFINTYGTLVSGGESSNKVEYNGAVIASLEAGQTATLQCANKKAVSDITITFVSAGTIAYNGTETAVEAGKTATFKCAGKKMLSDVAIVIAPAEEEPTIIKLETPVIELVVEGEETDEPQLTAPSVELDGTTLNIYDDEGIATSYDILVDGVAMDTVEVSNVNLISFTIAGTTYQAEEGMTYADWIDSEYNTGGFYTSGTFLLGADGAQYGIGPNMTISNVIEDGDALFMTSGGAM